MSETSETSNLEYTSKLAEYKKVSTEFLNVVKDKEVLLAISKAWNQDTGDFIRYLEEHQEWEEAIKIIDRAVKTMDQIRKFLALKK
jgi:hypothetical protein